MSNEFPKHIETPQEAIPKRSLDKSNANYIGPIFVVYRSNDFLDTNVQVLADTVTSAGGEIETHSFPAGTQREEIDEWYELNKDRLKGKRIITDWTARFEGEEGQEVSAILDPMFTEAMVRSIERSEGISLNGMHNGSYQLGRVASSEAVAQYDRGITSMIKNIFNGLRPEERPGAVFLIKDRLADHYPIPNDLDQSVTDSYNAGNHFPELSPSVIDSIAERVKTSIVNAGIPAENVHVVDSSSNLFTQEGEDSPRQIITQPQDWILIDRHVLKNAGFSNNRDDRKLQLQLEEAGTEDRSVTILRLPLGDFITDAKSEGLLRSAGDTVGATLEEFLLQTEA